MVSIVGYWVFGPDEPPVVIGYLGYWLLGPGGICLRWLLVIGYWFFVYLSLVIGYWFFGKLTFSPT